MLDKEFKDIMFNMSWDGFTKKCFEQKVLYEGLIKTYSADSTYRILRKKFPLLEIKKFISDSGSTTFFIYFEVKSVIPKLIKLMNTYGWFVSYPKDLDKIEIIRNNKFLIKFEAKYDVEVTDEINQKRFKINDKNVKYKRLFHLTPSVNLPKIEKIGLTPKSNSKNTKHPERVYLFTDELTDKNIENIIFQLYSSNKNAEQYKEEYTLLEIILNQDEFDEYLTTKPLPRFFKDPNMSFAIYTLENINPKQLKIIKTYNLK